MSPEFLTAPINFVFFLIILFFAAGAIPGGMIQDRIGPKKVTITGGALLGAGLVRRRPPGLPHHAEHQAD